MEGDAATVIKTASSHCQMFHPLSSFSGPLLPLSLKTLTVVFIVQGHKHSIHALKAEDLSTSKLAASPAYQAEHVPSVGCPDSLASSQVGTSAC